MYARTCRSISHLDGCAGHRRDSHRLVSLPLARARAHPVRPSRSHGAAALAGCAAAAAGLKPAAAVHARFAIRALVPVFRPAAQSRWLRLDRSSAAGPESGLRSCREPRWPARVSGEGLRGCSLPANHRSQQAPTQQKQTGEPVHDGSRGSRGAFFKFAIVSSEPGTTAFPGSRCRRCAGGQPAACRHRYRESRPRPR